MDQCAGLTLRQPFERFGGPRFVARQLLVLTHQPSDQGPVHTPPDRLERRAVEMAVVLLPSPQDRSEHGRKISQALVVLQLDPPSPDCLPHRFEGVAADGRREVHIDAAILVDRLAGSERVAEKGELDVGVRRGPIDVLAIQFSADLSLISTASLTFAGSRLFATCWPPRGARSAARM